MKKTKLSKADINRIIEMAWEDAITFEAIYTQYGLTNGDVIKLMRSKLKPSSFRMWRKRTRGRISKHGQLFENSKTMKYVINIPL